MAAAEPPPPLLYAKTLSRAAAVLRILVLPPAPLGGEASVELLLLRSDSLEVRLFDERPEPLSSVEHPLFEAVRDAALMPHERRSLVLLTAAGRLQLLQVAPGGRELRAASWSLWPTLSGSGGTGRSDGRTRVRELLTVEGCGWLVLRGWHGLALLRLPLDPAARAHSVPLPRCTVWATALLPGPLPRLLALCQLATGPQLLAWDLIWDAAKRATEASPVVSLPLGPESCLPLLIPLAPDRCAVFQSTRLLLVPLRPSAVPITQPWPLQPVAAAAGCVTHDGTSARWLLLLEDGSLTQLLYHSSTMLCSFTALDTKLEMEPAGMCVLPGERAAVWSAVGDVALLQARAGTAERLWQQGGAGGTRDWLLADVEGTGRAQLLAVAHGALLRLHPGLPAAALAPPITPPLRPLTHLWAAGSWLILSGPARSTALRVSGGEASGQLDLEEAGDATGLEEGVETLFAVALGPLVVQVHKQAVQVAHLPPWTPLAPRETFTSAAAYPPSGGLLLATSARRLLLVHVDPRGNIALQAEAELPQQVSSVALGADWWAAGLYGPAALLVAPLPLLPAALPRPLHLPPLVAPPHSLFGLASLLVIGTRDGTLLAFPLGSALTGHVSHLLVRQLGAQPVQLVPHARAENRVADEVLALSDQPHLLHTAADGQLVLQPVALPHVSAAAPLPQLGCWLLLRDQLLLPLALDRTATARFQLNRLPLPTTVAVRRLLWLPGSRRLVLACTPSTGCELRVVDPHTGSATAVQALPAEARAVFALTTLGTDEVGERLCVGTGDSGQVSGDILIYRYLPQPTRLVPLARLTLDAFVLALCSAGPDRLLAGVGPHLVALRLTSTLQLTELCRLRLAHPVVAVDAGPSRISVSTQKGGLQLLALDETPAAFRSLASEAQPRLTAGHVQLDDELAVLADRLGTLVVLHYDADSGQLTSREVAVGEALLRLRAGSLRLRGPAAAVALGLGGAVHAVLPLSTQLAATVRRLLALLPPTPPLTHHGGLLQPRAALSALPLSGPVVLHAELFAAAMSTLENGPRTEAAHLLAELDALFV